MFSMKSVKPSASKRTSKRRIQSVGTGENAVSGLRLLLQACSPLVVPPGIGLVVANGNLS